MVFFCLCGKTSARERELPITTTSRSISIFTLSRMECKRRAAAANCRPARTHSIVNTHTQQRIVGNHYKMLFIIIIIRNCQRERPAHHFIHTIEECYDKNGLKANGISNEASMAYSRSPKLNNFHNNLIVILPRQDLGIAPPTPIDKKFIYFYFLFKEKKRGIPSFFFSGVYKEDRAKV